MGTRKEFTKAEGLRVQAEQMKFWRSILKPSVYNKLVAYVASENLKLTGDDGYQVMRGTDLDSWVKNYK